MVGRDKMRSAGIRGDYRGKDIISGVNRWLVGIIGDQQDCYIISRYKMRSAELKDLNGFKR